MTTSPWTLVICGCGTVGYWTAMSFLKCRDALSCARIVLCDKAVIRENNMVTCPRYGGHIGRPKAERLTELCEDRAPTAHVMSSHTTVEQLRWNDVLVDSPMRCDQRVIVIVGLDSWESRLSVAEGLRRANGLPRNSLLMAQVGVDHGQASIAILGARLADPCPACGLLTLPTPQPCVVWGSDHTLIRGNLREEAQSAAGFVHRAVNDALGSSEGFAAWLNTKTNLFAPRADSRHYKRFTRKCRMQEGCFGPHSGASALRWDNLPIPPSPEFSELFPIGPSLEKCTCNAT